MTNPHQRKFREKTVSNVRKQNVINVEIAKVVIVSDNGPTSISGGINLQSTACPKSCLVTTQDDCKQIASNTMRNDITKIDGKSFMEKGRLGIAFFPMFPIIYPAVFFVNRVNRGLASMLRCNSTLLLPRSGKNMNSRGCQPTDLTQNNLSGPDRTEPFFCSLTAGYTCGYSRLGPYGAKKHPIRAWIFRMAI